MKFAYVALRPVVCKSVAIVNTALRYEVLENMFMISKPHYKSCGEVVFVKKTVLYHYRLPTAREGNVFKDICLFTRGVGYPPLEADTPYSGGRPPLEVDPLVLTSSGGHCSGRYTSYWNAFLLCLCG